MPFPKLASLISLTCLALVAACGKPAQRPADRAESRGPEADYAAPPAVTEVRATVTGVVITGTASPGREVRLGAPTGQAVFAVADASGHWRIGLPPSDDTRIFGVSTKAQGRQVQGQGYLVIGPQGRAALLRAGAGAVRLDPPQRPALGALDFDRDGAAVVSGTAGPSELVFVRVDGRPVGEGRSDSRGHFAVALPEPQPRTPAIRPGEHRIEVSGEGFSDTADVAVSPPAPLVDGPLRSQFTKGGLRVDWMTPGGGVQSTLLLD